MPCSLIAVSGFLTPQGAASFGWTGYAPLSNATFTPGLGGNMWVIDSVRTQAQLLTATDPFFSLFASSATRCSHSSLPRCSLRCTFQRLCEYLSIVYWDYGHWQQA